jgi:phage/plasmid-like protein (TIGR03299 family)
MAHELETFTDGTAAFVSAREHAWHRLGTVLPDAFSAAEAMTHAHLGGWNVHKEALQAVVMREDGVHTIDVPDHYATVRTHPVTGAPEALGVVGPGYVPIQNEEHADLLDTLVDESGAHFETAGSMRGGRQVFLTMRLPDQVSIGGVDPLTVYLAACNSHDGSMAFRLLVTPVRIVCANTQAAAIRRARSAFSVHHTSGARGQIQAAREALGLTFRYMTAFQVEAERMINTTLTEAEFAGIVREVWPDQAQPSQRAATNTARREARLLHLFTDADTTATIRGTRWAAYQAVTEYLDHHTPVGPGRDAATIRAQRAVSGPVTDRKRKAFDLLAV